jgi:hypothetical protein
MRIRIHIQRFDDQKLLNFRFQKYFFISKKLKYFHPKPPFLKEAQVAEKPSSPYKKALSTSKQ